MQKNVPKRVLQEQQAQIDLLKQQLAKENADKDQTE